MEKKKSENKKDEKKTTSNKKGKLKIEDENALKDFLVDELKDIYFAENEILKGLTKMKDAASSTKLKKAIDKHYNQTETQIVRLEEAFKLFDEKPVKKKCKAIVGILAEGDDILEDTEEGTMTRDAAIIIASQKVEHYEIATYGSLAELARTINREDVAKLLEKTLKEEKKTDVTLTVLAVDKINEQAAQEPAE
jgi:ferritin-like metal-binding protein YciE